MRSGGPVPRFSPRMVTLVQATPSLGEMPVTNGGWRARDMVAWGKQKGWTGQHLEKFTKNLFKFLKHLSLKRKWNIWQNVESQIKTNKVLIINIKFTSSVAECAENFPDDSKATFAWQTALSPHK